MAAKLQKSVVFYFNSEEGIKKYPVSLGDSDFSHRVDEMVKILRQQRQYTLRELKGNFTLNEMQLICDATSDILYAGEMSAKVVLAYAIADGVDFDKLNEKWEVDVQALKEKVRALTEFQAYAVITMAFEYKALEEEERTEEKLKKIFMIG